MIAALTFILTLSVLVFVHEFGHFWAARRSGVTVHEFGFGFPPRITGIRRGATLYSINLIPFGGFVKLEGENEASDAPGSFRAAPLSRRALILAAGVGMNILLSLVVFSITLTAGVPSEVDPASLPAGAKDVHVTVSDVLDGSPAQRAGVAVADRIVAIDGVSITSIDALRHAVETAPTEPHTLVVRTGTSERALSVTAAPDAEGAPRIGIAGTTVAIVSVPFPESIGRAAQLTLRLIGEVFRALGTLVSGFVHGKVAADVTGPIGIAVLSSRVSAIGLTAVLQFLGALSISLAVLNILPLPALDGGRILFTLIEAIRRRPVSHRVEGAFHTVGFYLLIALVVLVSVKDLRQFQILDRLTGLFR